MTWLLLGKLMMMVRAILHSTLDLPGGRATSIYRTGNWVDFSIGLDIRSAWGKDILPLLILQPLSSDSVLLSYQSRNNAQENLHVEIKYSDKSLWDSDVLCILVIAPRSPLKLCRLGCRKTRQPPHASLNRASAKFPHVWCCRRICF
jgi:hypothetical protein